MQSVEFFAADPRSKARRKLEQLLNHGVDQVAIACAFCTGAGVQLLEQQIARLKKSNSFVVVAAACPPTTQRSPICIIRFRIISMSIGVRFCRTKLTSARLLMHSKVFYARHGNECWLWTGSNNLTGNATQGG